jgi:hypothetical protein
MPDREVKPMPAELLDDSDDACYYEMDAIHSNEAAWRAVNERLLALMPKPTWRDRLAAFLRRLASRIER